MRYLVEYKPANSCPVTELKPRSILQAKARARYLSRTLAAVAFVRVVRRTTKIGAVAFVRGRMVTQTGEVY